jgi:hypothetical protein
MPTVPSKAGSTRKARNEAGVTSSPFGASSSTTGAPSRLQMICAPSGW